MSATDAAGDRLEELVASILQSPRYRHVAPEAVRRIGAGELIKRRTWKDAVKETRSRLHQIGGAYLDTIPPYAAWTEALRNAPNADALRAELCRIMRCHASTRERLPILETFYTRILSAIRPVRSVVDIACGLNPLALPWMGMAEDVRYTAFDLYADMTKFLDGAVHAAPFLPPWEVRVETRDVSARPPDIEADLALVLKFLPLLDRPDSAGTLDWLKRLRTRYALISFPTRTLGGRNVGMAASHEARFRETLEEARWSSERFEFASELCFVVEMRPPSGAEPGANG